MPLRCADCNHKLLLTPDGATQSIACPNCGGKRLERDQPSPTHGDMEARNMVNPSIGLDQGGNPNMEGIWANNGWQPYHRRDESYASVKTADFDFGGFDFESEPRVPTHHVIVDRYGQVHSGSFPETHEDIAARNRLTDSVNGVSKGAVYPEGDTEWYTHDSGHDPAAMEQMLYGHFGRPVSVDPGLQAKSENSRWGLGPEVVPKMRELDVLQGAPRLRSRGRPLDRNEGLVRGGGVIEANEMEALDEHFPFHVAAPAQMAPPVGTQQAPQYTQEAVIPGSAPNAAKAGDGSNLGIHAGTTKWLGGFLDAHVDGLPVRGNEMEIIRRYAGKGEPVTVSAHHPDHLRAAVDVIEHSATGGVPSPVMIEVGRGVQRGQIPPPPGIGEGSFKKRGALEMTYGIRHLAFLPALLGLGAGLLGGGAESGLMSTVAPFLMRGALMGAGSNMVQGLMGTQDAAGQQPSSMPPPPGRDLEAFAKTADLETPHTTPALHDSPDGDNQQFKDQSTDPNFNNPNVDAEAGGAAIGEDNVGPAFGPKSPSMDKFNLLFPAILHYYHSDQSAAQDPMIRELHDMMDKESPGYLDSVNDEQGSQAVQHLIEHLRKPEHIHSSIREAIGPVGWNAVPDTRDVRDPNQVNWAQPQGMPGAAPCAYCGGQVGPDGICTQCHAQSMPGAQPPQGQMGQIGPAQSVPPGGYRSPTPFTGSRQAADTQGPVSPEQIAAVQQLLLDTGREQEVPNVPLFPENYVAELQQVTQQGQTTPPPVDPNQQPPAAPPMDPSMMGQMPPGQAPMGGPPAGGSPFATSKVATPHPGAPRCPECNSATTGFARNGLEEVSGVCHSCGNIWDLPEGASVRTADIGTENPAGVPAADQHQPYDPANDQDSSHTWQDQDGEPLTPGREYEMFTGQMPIPDRVRIDQVKPDEIVYTTIGELDPSANPNDPNGGPLTYQNRISREEMQVQGYSFQKADDQNSDAGEQHLDQYADTSQAPQFTEPVSQPQISPRGAVHEAVTPYDAQDPQMQELLQRYDQMTPQQQQAMNVALTMRQNNMGMENARNRALNPVQPIDFNGAQNPPSHMQDQPAPLPGDPNYRGPKWGATIQKTAPMSEYDHLFGGSGGAAKALKAMKDKYGDEKGESIFYATVNKRKKKSAEEEPEPQAADYCPKCASQHISSSMSSPTTEFHECYRCAHTWETREDEYEAEGAQQRAWLMSSGPATDDFWAGYERAQKMDETGRGQTSRSLSAAAARDPRNQEISERLAERKMEREAGRKFTPYEQRQFIDENGVARNADMLDLAGTHYESHRYLGEKANGMNVPDEELFLGF